jgi:hypothetical protein
MEDDVVRLNVALFLRLMELAREDIRDDVSLHFVTEIVTRIRQSDELETIKRLGGL